MYEVKDFDKKDWAVVSDKDKYILIKDDGKNLPSNWIAKAITYESIDPEKHYWNQLKIEIYKQGVSVPYIYFNRNYPAAPKICYTKMANNHEYLITTGDYQCITIIDLTAKSMESYCIGNHSMGSGFCPTDIDVFKNEDNSIDIEIEGCYWGGEYERCILKDIQDLEDFEIPDEIEFLEIPEED